MEQEKDEDQQQQPERLEPHEHENSPTIKPGKPVKGSTTSPTASDSGCTGTEKDSDQQQRQQ